MITRRPTKADKTHRFACYYRGWSDAMACGPAEPPGPWSAADRDLYHQGHAAAALAAERFRAEARTNT